MYNYFSLFILTTSSQISSDVITFVQNDGGSLSENRVDEDEVLEEDIWKPVVLRQT